MVFHRSSGDGRRVRFRIKLYEALSRFTSQPRRANQWESWRLWETWSAGAAVLQLDFEKFGISLPVQPRNQEHYIGVYRDHRDRELFTRLLDDPGWLAQVAANGREWARTHYNPVATARRFLALAAQHGFAWPSDPAG